MIIGTTTEDPRLVEDWDINFVNGSAMSISIDTSAGDSYEVIPGNPMAHFYVCEKPSPFNENDVLAAEDVYIPMTNVLCFRRKLRFVEELSPEAKAEWQAVLEEMSASPVKH